MIKPGWTLTADDVAALPLDELALAVLRDAFENQEWNSYNWLELARQEQRTARTL